MNKRELVDAVAERVGSKKIAGEAVDAILDTIQDTVAKGEKVAITGFGSFEKADRPAREARNPATGATIKVAGDVGPEVQGRCRFQGSGGRSQEEVTPEEATHTVGARRDIPSPGRRRRPRAPDLRPAGLRPATLRSVRLRSVRLRAGGTSTG